MIARAIDHGWREPIVLYHAGMTAEAAGRPAEARRLLRRALAQKPPVLAASRPAGAPGARASGPSA